MINDSTDDPRETFGELLESLLGLSRLYGSDTDFVIAGGGNTSVKNAGRLLVKASGRSLGNIDATGFVEMDRSCLAATLDKKYGDDPKCREELFKQAIMAARVDPQSRLRPSVESVLHHLLPSALVVHTHPTLVNMLSCCTKGQAIFEELMGKDSLWIPCTDPGITLAKILKAAIEDYQERAKRQYPPAIVVQNHGLIVCGQTAQEVRKLTDEIISKIRSRIDENKMAAAFGSTAPEVQNKSPLINMIAPALRGLLSEGDNLKIVTFDDSAEILSLACGSNGQTVAEGGPLTPDQIVYCNSYPLWTKLDPAKSVQQVVQQLREDISKYQKAHKVNPRIVLVAGVGMFAAGDDFASAASSACVYKDAVKVMAGAISLGGVLPMSKQSREFIENWEAEAYRKNVAAANRNGRAAGKVVLVTGAAQGFGLEIARDFASQGAHVVLADLNVKGAAQAAEDMCRAAGAGKSFAVELNVIDSASIEAGVSKTVRQFGGIDVLVSNAGVLRAASIKEQSEKDFDFVTDVNYKGYFLCVQKVSPIMSAQHAAKPSCWSDIIQINSKSGLAGSNRNFAYAGSKFGGIGLTQSFAMELIEDGIKVNSVCPGNFFEGPLWSDPEKGLFVQYLRTGKVAGAKTIEDVKRAYEAKVPMGRGCQAIDVMRTIYYIIEQQYETGQAIPVTGGQVMLK